MPKFVPSNSLWREYSPPPILERQDLLPCEEWEPCLNPENEMPFVPLDLFINVNLNEV